MFGINSLCIDYINQINKVLRKNNKEAGRI